MIFCASVFCFFLFFFEVSDMKFRCKFTPDGVSAGQLWPLLLICACETYAWSSVLTYAGFLVVDFVPGVDVSRAGFLSGILMSAFFLCQTISSTIAGWVSDKIGRKRVLVFGTVGNIFSTAFLGFSVNFPMALTARCCNGLLNGNIVVLEAFFCTRNQWFFS